VIVRGSWSPGIQVLDGQRRWAASGVIRGYDAVTGELRFAWDMNQPEVTKLPPDGKPYSLGTPNMWTTAVGDESSSSSTCRWATRPATTIRRCARRRRRSTAPRSFALDVNTGKPRWVFQTVHNDVWD